MKKYDLELRDDSVLCKNYIEDDEGDVEKIASIMNEMDFYFTYTIYEHLISDYDYRRKYGSDGCKLIALKDYVKNLKIINKLLSLIQFLNLCIIIL